MKYFLDDFIGTLGPDGGRRAAFVLADAKIEKEQFKSIVGKLEKNMSIGKLELSPVVSFQDVSGSDLESKFRELNLTVSEIFQRSNYVSLLLDNYVGVLGSDIKALEDELAVLEKNVNNYAFLIADNGAFDYAYLEGFSDERGRELELEEIPDRAGRNFNVADWANVDTQTGELTMSNFGAGSHRWPIQDVRMVRNNVSALLTSRDHATLKNMIQPRSDNGWKVSIKSPSLISGQVEGFKEEETTPSGPQFVFEFTLASPAPCDTITILPFSDWDFIISEVRTYEGDDDSKYKSILDDPIAINGAFNINFPTNVISRFRIYARQPTYRRVSSRPVAAEDGNKKMFDELLEKNVLPDSGQKPNTLTPLSGSKSSYGWWDQRMLMFLEDKNKLRKNNSPFAVGIPRADFRKNWGSFSYRSNRLQRNAYEENYKAWASEDWTTRLVEDVVKDIANSENLWSSVFNSPKQVKPANGATSDNLRTDRDSTLPFSSSSTNPKTVQPLGEGHSSMPYVYKMGIRHVEVGQSSTRDRAVFVSRRMDAPGDIGTVRIKSDYVNRKVTDTDRDTDRITSIEFSVTPVAKPISEIDWIPILPIDTPEVIGERLFPDVSGKAFLRFTAKIDAPIRVYINGYHKKDYDIKDIARRKDSRSGLAYDALTLPVSDYTSSDILTVDYTPSHDFATIDFPPLDPTASPPLVSSYDENGAGEGFLSSGNQLIVTTRQNPYIDYKQVATSTYDTSHGLSGYSPLTVRFEDGTIAYNLTNYKGGTQSALDPGSDDIQYLQSGKSLMFNKVVAQPFRVYYQFQPSDVRVRVVLRCNYTSFATPRVDYFQLKAKTKKADAKRKL